MFEAVIVRFFSRIFSGGFSILCKSFRVGFACENYFVSRADDNFRRRVNFCSLRQGVRRRFCRCCRKLKCADERRPARVCRRARRFQTSLQTRSNRIDRRARIFVSFKLPTAVMINPAEILCSLVNFSSSPRKS